MCEAMPVVSASVAAETAVERGLRYKLGSSVITSLGTNINGLNNTGGAFV